jgi:hypothetical protein
MTIVNTATGEITEALTEADAKRLTERIRLIAENVAEQMDKLAGLIDQARVGSAWLALGYRSWTAYVAAEFANVLPRLDREPRQEFTRELAARGMSTRAIAPVVGVDNATVHRDLTRVASATPETPQGGVVRTPAVPDATTEAPTATPRPAVIGLDGKTYTPPAPRPRATEADLAEFIESDSSVQDRRYVVALMKVLTETASVSQFDSDRIATLADDLTMTAIDAAFDNFTAWRDRVIGKRSGLRVIKGGSL